jgi:hypothetical protein
MNCIAPIRSLFASINLAIDADVGGAARTIGR